MSVPRPHGRCLGDRVADLADGRLDPAAAERAYAHVAACGPCRVALEAQRQSSARLERSAPVEPSADLLGRLRGIAAAADPGDADLPASDPAAIPAQPAAGVRPRGAAGLRPAATLGSTRPATVSGSARRRRGRVVLGAAAGAAALAVAAVMGGTSASLSAPVRPTPSIAPVVDALTDAHATTADRMPFSGPRIVTAGFPAASSLEGSPSSTP